MRYIGNEHTRVAVFDDVTDLDRCRELLGELDSALHDQGAVLLRGLPADLELFDEITRLVGGSPLEYTERSTPRSEVQGAIYTSTEYPPDQSIPMHNESSYSENWPRLLFLLCAVPAESGGATPVADSRAVYRALPADVRERFARGVVYTRSFRQGLGLSWQEAFQTDDPAAVEKYCTEHGQSFEWTDEGLRTSHHRPAWQVEPRTGDTVWFNQAHLFHATSLEPDVLEALLSLYAEEDLPRHAYYGDGSPIERADLDAVRKVYDEVSFAFPWETGDVMIVNNMLVAHGRQPFTGTRRTLVSMTD
ncbi:TauD/TfdA family dioxygenase [Streptomyces sp. NBC_00029]|uniref:TauD/TfdA family dioxygenase n=1 Tax=Streptomyces sp. NBC_00029 TaxID=2903613 RepID=UPI00325393B3